MTRATWRGAAEPGRRRGGRALGAAAVTALGLPLLAGACAAGAGEPAAGGWGIARQIPGLAALNTGTAGGGGAGVSSLSCGSPGNCAAVGTYDVGRYRQRAYLASQVRGTWGKAERVPGLAALDKGGYEAIGPVSCAAAGDCAAVGGYTTSTHRPQGFVISEVHGIWGKARPLPGLAKLSGGRFSSLTAVSCAAAGSCSVSGTYGPGHGRVFVDSQVRGIWGTPVEVPGIKALDHNGFAVIPALSCGSAGNCAAGGYYKPGQNQTRPFIVDQVRGVWGTAQDVPGPATSGSGDSAGITTMSCASAGNCSAAGFRDTADAAVAVVVSEVHGTWGSAQQIPGLAKLARRSSSELLSLSCASAGNCSAGGDYGSDSEDSRAFVVSEVHGIWGRAGYVPGLDVLDKGRNSSVVTVSCPSPGNCTAGGSYSHGPLPGIGHPDSQAFVVTLTDGTWGRALEVPGTGALNKHRDGTISTVSCAAVRKCSAGGSYYDGSYVFQAFVISHT